MSDIDIDLYEITRFVNGLSRSLVTMRVDMGECLFVYKRKDISMNILSVL